MVLKPIEPLQLLVNAWHSDDLQGSFDQSTFELPESFSGFDQMALHDSDSSGDEDEQYATTNVMLGYASKEPTDDTFSHLGGVPVSFLAHLEPIVLFVT